MRRVATVAALAVGLLALTASPAWAPQGGGGWSDPGGIGADAGEGGSGGSSGGGGGGGGPAKPCTPYHIAPDGSFVTGTHGSGVTYVHHPTELIYGGSMDGPDPHYGEAGAYYDKLCNGVYMDTVWIPERTPRQTAEDLAGEAAEYVPYPKPTIGSSPAPGQDHLVRLRSFFWIDPAAWQPQTASASVPGITSTVVATPKRVVWSMGNGDQVVCDNPGTPYDPSLREESQVTDCSYVYPSSSAGQPNERFTVTARIEWEVTWSAPAVGIGAVPLPPGASANSTTVRVAEVQALNTTTA